MTDSHQSRHPIVITIAGTLLIGAIAGLPFFVGPPNQEGLPDTAKFIGRFHPVVLHLPIGMIIWVIVSELLNVFSKRSDAPSSRTAMGFAAASAVIAALLGFVLYHSTPDYDRELVERHLYGGLAFSCASILAYVIKVWADTKGGKGTWLYRTVLLASVGIMTITSHDGASLTHGKGYLTDYASEPLRRSLGMEPRRTEKKIVDQDAERAVYAGIIVPILESKCYSCHNEEKQKGRYRMDRYEMLLAGGNEGEAIVRGKSAESNLVIRIELPESDEEHMPPEGKKDLEDHEVLLIKWWIDNGASKDAKISDLPANDAVKSAIKKSVPASTAKPQAKQTVEADTSLKKIVEQLRQDFPALQFEAKDSSRVVFTAVGLGDRFDDAALAKLAPVLPSMVSLDISHTAVTDDGVKILASATGLKSLRLAETLIGDASLETLVNLTELESLNLYGTQVTSQGLIKLCSLQKLKKLYLWRTKVDEMTLQDLREKLPACEIVTGI